VTYGAWFKIADEDHDGRLTGADAVKFFCRSGLAKEDLAKVWAVADSTRQGYLGKAQFLKAMVAVALAQMGQPIHGESVSAGVEKGSGLPMARMDGLEEVCTFVTSLLRSATHASDLPLTHPLCSCPTWCQATALGATDQRRRQGRGHAPPPPMRTQSYVSTQPRVAAHTHTHLGQAGA
jgi:hypothetical protein